MFCAASVFLFLSGFFANAESCEDWFRRLKISPSDAECEMKCALGSIDMGSFDCPSQCDHFCTPKNEKKSNCIVDPFWKNRLKGPAEPFKPVVGEEQTQLEMALSRLPKGFRPASLKAIVKGSRPVDFTAPSTEATSTDEFVILYPRAFSDPSHLDRIIVHEIVHVLIIKEWADTFEKYKKASGWAAVTESGYRKGDFVEYDGKTSPEEDFANNVEYFLFDRKALKNRSPAIFNWLQNNLGQKVRLEKGCPNEK